MKEVTLGCFAVFCLTQIGCRTAKPPINPINNGARPLNPAVASPSPLKLTAIGEVVSYNTVVVKSRVDGPIIQIAFREGQNVERGALLAVIDPAMYRAALNEALATRDKDSAELAQAKSTFDRDKALYAESIIAKQQLEIQETTFHQMESTVRADQVGVDRASLELSYTKIVAPIEGRIGFKTKDVGSIVHSGDADGIVTITQIQPITIVFSVTPDRLNQILKSMRRRPVQVEAFSEDGKRFLGRGEVLTSDTVIDSATGAGKIKAIFSNVDQSLWPNEFVQIALHLGPPD